MSKLLSPLTAAALAVASFLASPARVAAAPPDGWRMVFNDEFSGDRLDGGRWGTTMHFLGTKGPRFHNDYYLSYTMDDDVISEGGFLRLRNQRRTVPGFEPPGIYNFTQGFVSTAGRFAYTHGYLEVRAKFPGGKGLWPCVWLMPEDQSWPPEFDVAEYLSGQKRMHFGLAHGTWQDTAWTSRSDTQSDFESDFHTFALEWTPGRAVWFVDGVVRHIVTGSEVPSVPMFLILSNSVSSRLGPSGEPDAATPFPNFFEIDYVRVYQPMAAAERPWARFVTHAPLKERDPAPPIARTDSNANRGIRQRGVRLPAQKPAMCDLPPVFRKRGASRRKAHRRRRK